MSGREPSSGAAPGPVPGGGAAHPPPRSPPSGPSAPQYYEIRVDGVLGRQWAAWFSGLRMSVDGQQTVLSGPVPDQSALHGILVKIDDLGLSLASVGRGGPGDAGKCPSGKAGQP